MTQEQDHPRLVDDLIYDVGMHRGEDTAYYLAKGYRVVAIEANPALADECRSRFADAIASGRLTIVEGAIADTLAAEVDFHVDRVSVWGSIDPDWVRKKNIERAQRTISVPVVDLAACMRSSGVPHYLKIDIEGADRICLAALRGLPERPTFVSMEAELHDLDVFAADVELLEQLGYRRFARVPQIWGDDRRVTTRTLSGDPLAYRFPAAASGPFGSDLEVTWHTSRGLARSYRRAARGRRVRATLLKPDIVRRIMRRAYHRSPRVRRAAGGHDDIHAMR